MYQLEPQKLSSLDSIVGIPYNQEMRAKGQKRGNATRQTNQREKLARTRDPHAEGRRNTRRSNEIGKTTSRRTGSEETRAMGKVRQRLADLREALSVGTMLCIGAFLLSACAGWLLNGSVYAHVAEYCGIAREVSTLFSAGLFLVLFFVASRKPEALDRRIMAVGRL